MVSSSNATEDTQARHGWLLAVYVGLSILATLAVSMTAQRVIADEESFLRTFAEVLMAWSYGFLCAALVLWLHYTACRLCFRYWLIDDRTQSPRKVLWAMMTMTGAHLGQMTLWGVMLFVASRWLGLGVLEGDVEGKFIDYIYFSFAAYTSLGLGDVTPQDWLRMLTGLTTITGLLAIGWTCSLFVGKMGGLMDS